MKILQRLPFYMIFISYYISNFITRCAANHHSPQSIYLIRYLWKYSNYTRQTHNVTMRMYFRAK